jgi:hypothetical protein
MTSTEIDGLRFPRQAPGARGLSFGGGVNIANRWRGAAPRLETSLHHLNRRP